MDAQPTQTDAWTIARLLNWTREYFTRHDVESPRLCAELLLAHALGCERLQLYTRYEEAPDGAALAAFRSSVREAAAGRPIAHLTGRKEFFSLAFDVSADVLIPRPETEILVERVIDLARKSDGGIRRILDIGTGSGCIAISLARHLPAARIVATDISSAALEVARRNAERHDVHERIEFCEGNLFDALPEQSSAFDVIVSNPPYVSTAPDAPVQDSVRDYEPHVALFAGPDGLAIYRRLVAGAIAHLSAGAHLLVEIGFDQAAAARDLLPADNWTNVQTYRDAGGHERVIHARRAAASAAQVA